MKRTDIAEQVKHILQDDLLEFDGNVISENTRIREDLGADSLDMIGISCDIEKDFNITILDQEWEKIETFKEIVDLIESKLS